MDGVAIDSLYPNLIGVLCLTASLSTIRRTDALP
jgi:hypothetical protein